MMVSSFGEERNSNGYNILLLIVFFVCMPCYGISPVTAVNPLFGKQWWRNKLGELFLFDSLDSKWLLSDINLFFIVHVYSNKHHLNMPFRIGISCN